MAKFLFANFNKFTTFHKYIPGVITCTKTDKYHGFCVKQNALKYVNK